MKECDSCAAKKATKRVVVIGVDVNLCKECRECMEGFITEQRDSLPIIRECMLCFEGIKHTVQQHKAEI